MYFRYRRACPRGGSTKLPVFARCCCVRPLSLSEPEGSVGNTTATRAAFMAAPCIFLSYSTIAQACFPVQGHFAMASGLCWVAEFGSSSNWCYLRSHLQAETAIHRYIMSARPCRRFGLDAPTRCRRSRRRTGRRVCPTGRDASGSSPRDQPCPRCSGALDWALPFYLVPACHV